MGLRNFKSVSLLMAVVISVCSLANVASFGVMVNDQLIAELENLTGENKDDIKSFLKEVDIDKYGDISNFLSKDGTVKILSIPVPVLYKIKEWAQSNGYSASYSNGKGYLLKNGKTISTKQIADILYKETNDTGSASSNSGGSANTSSNSGGSANNSNTLISDNLFTYNNQLTNSPVVSSFVLDATTQGVKVDGEKMCEKLLNSTQPAAVTLNVPNARWAIESSSLDKNAITGYQFDPCVNIKNFKELDSNISDGLKSIINGQEGKVVSWAEKNGKKLPFDAKVLVSLSTADALKDFDVYYVVAGQTYKLGKFKLDSQGQIIFNFKVIGDFILVEHK